MSMSMAQELDELRQYKKRARYVMAKLHNEKDEMQELIDKMSQNITRLEAKVLTLELVIKNFRSNVMAHQAIHQDQPLPPT